MAYRALRIRASRPSLDCEASTATESMHYIRPVRRGLVEIGVRIAAVTLAIAACDPPSPARHASSGASGRVDLPWPLPSPSTSMEIPAELRAPVEPGSHL